MLHCQSLCIKQTCSKTSHVIKHLNDLKDAFIQRGYQSKTLKYHFQRAISRKILLENKEKPSTQGNVLLVLTFNKLLTNIKIARDKHSHILPFKENLRKVFNKRPSIAHRKNANLHQLIKGNRIFNNKVVFKNIKQPKQLGHCSPCLSRISNLCCNQVEQTKTFQSYWTKKTFQTFYNLTCESENLIYLLQFRICQLQYVGKSETLFNIRLSNQRKDAKLQASILACKRFYEQIDNFQQHAEFRTEFKKKQESLPDTVKLEIKQRNRGDSITEFK